MNATNFTTEMWQPLFLFYILVAIGFILWLFSKTSWTSPPTKKISNILLNIITWGGFLLSCLSLLIALVMFFSPSCPMEKCFLQVVQGLGFVIGATLAHLMARSSKPILKLINPQG